MKNQRELQNMVNEMIYKISPEISKLEKQIKELENKKYYLQRIYMYDLNPMLRLIAELVSKIEEKEYVPDTYKYQVRDGFGYECIKKVYLREKKLDEKLLRKYFTRFRDEREFSECQIKEIEKSYIFISTCSGFDGDPFIYGREDVICFNRYFSSTYSYYENYFDIEVEDKYNYILDFINKYLLQYRLENGYYNNDYHWKEYRNLVDSYVEEYKNQRKLCKKM